MTWHVPDGSRKILGFVVMRANDDDTIGTKRNGVPAANTASTARCATAWNGQIERGTHTDRPLSIQIAVKEARECAPPTSSSL